ncbi:MAG: CsgG/HfaB family protein [Hyphomonas sp.]
MSGLSGIFKVVAMALPILISACATASDNHPGIIQRPAVSEVRTETQSRLRSLPPPRERAAVAVYRFDDQTGQFKPSNVQTLSKAVTQGSTSVLLKALQDAGDRSWFTVIERENLDNLLKERQIIREMRRQYLGEEELNEAALPPLLFAGIILEGGIIGYDTNTLTGGAGARFLGIGSHTNYREDKVTVYLRAVSVKTGEVITSVVASKKIASFGVSANVFRYVSFKELLEVDTGFTTNEPDLLALRQATEKAVELLILEGADLGIWDFQDQMAGAEVMKRYRAERDGILPDDTRFASGDAPKVASRTQSPRDARAARTRSNAAGSINEMQRVADLADSRALLTPQ